MFIIVSPADLTIKTWWSCNLAILHHNDKLSNHALVEHMSYTANFIYQREGILILCKLCVQKLLLITFSRYFPIFITYCQHTITITLCLLTDELKSVFTLSLCSFHLFFLRTSYFSQMSHFFLILKSRINGACWVIPSGLGKTLISFTNLFWSFLTKTMYPSFLWTKLIID